MLTRLSTKILLQLLTYHLAGSPFSRYVENCLVPLTSALSLLLIHPAVASHPDLAEHIFDVLSLFSDSLSDDARSQCFRALHDQNRVKDSRLLFLFGNMESLESDWLQLLTSGSSALASKTEEPSGPVIATQPFLFRRWEMMQDATPIVTENDTSLNLMLFGTRKSVL